MTKEQFLGIVRHALSALGGTALALGWAADSTVTQASGAVLTLAALGWSLAVKEAAPQSIHPSGDDPAA